MSKTMLSLLAGVSFVALTGAAGAVEPIKLTDNQMDKVTAAGFVDFDTDIDVNVDIDKDVDINVDADVDADVDVDGHLAVAEASADAFGSFGTLSITDAFAQTTSNSSESFSFALAATD